MRAAACYTFEKLNCNLPEMDLNNLSSDQLYLYQICQAISSGQCLQNLALRNSGKMKHFRRPMTANRILRFYVTCINPFKPLKILTEFILKVYAPIWFSTKKKPSRSKKNWSRHLFTLMESSCYLSAELKQVVHLVIHRNAYFSHPENRLLAMITYDRQHVRKLGLRRILKAKQGIESINQNKDISQFHIPALNFSTKDYTNLIDWKNFELSVPPTFEIIHCRSRTSHDRQLKKLNSRIFLLFLSRSVYRKIRQNCHRGIVAAPRADPSGPWPALNIPDPSNSPP